MTLRMRAVGKERLKQRVSEKTPAAFTSQNFLPDRLILNGKLPEKILSVPVGTNWELWELRLARQGGQTGSGAVGAGLKGGKGDKSLETGRCRRIQMTDCHREASLQAETC